MRRSIQYFKIIRGILYREVKEDNNDDMWCYKKYTGFIQARLCKIQGLLKDFPTVFKDWKLKKNTDLHVKILFWKLLESITKDISLRKLV